MCESTVCLRLESDAQIDSTMGDDIGVPWYSSYGIAKAEAEGEAERKAASLAFVPKSTWAGPGRGSPNPCAGIAPTSVFAVLTASGQHEASDDVSDEVE